MEISRARFLLLASALAASACTIKEKDDPDGTGGQSSGGSGGSSGGSGGTEAGAGGSGGTESEAGAADSGVPDASVNPEAGTDGGGGDVGDGGAGDGGVCDDSVGVPGDCAVVSSAESCGLASFQSGNCDSASLWMKPGIAAKFVACITGQTEAELCDATNTYECKDRILKAACPDPTVADWCNAIVARCPGESVTECQTYLSGLNDLGRDNVESCMESDCFSLYSCVEGL